MATGGLAGVPVLVLGNKIDSPGSVGEEELRAQLGLSQTTGKVSDVWVESSYVFLNFNA